MLNIVFSKFSLNTEFCFVLEHETYHCPVGGGGSILGKVPVKDNVLCVANVIQVGT